MRDSLIYATLWLACFASAAAAQPKQFARVPITAWPNQLTREGHVVVLPDHGTIYIVSDLHAHWNDFNQWLQRTQLIERIQAGEDVYGLILGDAIDYKPGEPRHPPYGDTLIVNRVIELQQQLGDKGKRLIYLRGNHEFAAADAYSMLKRHGMTAKNRPHMIRQLYNSPSGAYYEQFNFIERMTDAHYAFLTRLPTVVIGKNGFVGVHAGPARTPHRLSRLSRCGAQNPRGTTLASPGYHVQRWIHPRPYPKFPQSHPRQSPHRWTYPNQLFSEAKRQRRRSYIRRQSTHFFDRLQRRTRSSDVC